MSMTTKTELEQFRQFIDEQLDSEGDKPSPEEVLCLFRRDTQQPDLDEEVVYRPVPPKATKVKRIKCVRVGRALPLPYSIDEDALTSEENDPT